MGPLNYCAEPTLMSDFDNNPRRRGACPSAGAAMESGDGLLSRVRVPGGRLESDTLFALADWAERWGSGLIELTSRGNLQIRGLNAAGEQALTRALIDAGLAVTPPEAEAVRNVISNAAADLDPEAVADPWPIRQAIEQALLADNRFRRLPAKFRMVVNGGGVTDLGAMDADIRADALSDAEQPQYRIALGGTRESAEELGVWAAERVEATLLELTRAFLALNERLPAPATRLRPLLEHFGIGSFRDQMHALPKPAKEPFPKAMETPLGAHPGWFGAGLPFGELTSDRARALAELARKHCHGQLRLTPWRKVLLPYGGPELAPELEHLGLILNRADPRHALIACPGAPRCLSGSTRTRADGLQWAKQIPELFDGELTLHISGCAKGCAHPRANTLTLTADNGRYDLILNDHPAPRHDASRLARGLSPDEVPRYLKALAARLNENRQPGESLKHVIRRMDPAQLRL